MAQKKNAGGQSRTLRVLNSSGVIVKVHQSVDRFVIAACDKELVGKTLKQGTMVMTLAPHFYQGEEKSEEEVIEIFRHAPNANIVGKKAVALGIRAGLITRENITTIQGIPHAQSYTIEYS